MSELKDVKVEFENDFAEENISNEVASEVNEAAEKGTNGDNKDNQDNDGNDKLSKFVKELFSWLMVFVVASVAAFIISHYIIINAIVPTGSMISTINEGDKVIGNRLAYTFSDPKKGDIVLFWSPIKKNTIYIKRLIGTPGDTIDIHDGKLFVNGKEQNESYVNGKPTYAYSGLEYDKDSTFSITLGKDEYFMMGDNRTNSNDSRSWGVVNKDAIIAKGILKWSPKLKRLK